MRLLDMFRYYRTRKLQNRAHMNANSIILVRLVTSGFPSQRTSNSRFFHPMTSSPDWYFSRKQVQHIPRNMHMVFLFKARSYQPRQQGSWGLHGTHLGPTGPRWVPCWPMNLVIRETTVDQCTMCNSTFKKCQEEAVRSQSVDVKRPKIYTILQFSDTNLTSGVLFSDMI